MNLGNIAFNFLTWGAAGGFGRSRLHGACNEAPIIVRRISNNNFK